MKKFIYKLAIISFFLFITYELTIGKEIRKVEKYLIEKISGFNVSQNKENIKNEIKELLNKDKIFYEEDAELISKLIKKILIELKF